MPEIVVGRDDEDMEKYGSEGTLFLGRHIVGTGEDTHLTTPLLLDVLRPHVITLTGKRGGGKCLSADTEIVLEDGKCVPIKDLEKDDSKILALNEKLKIGPSEKTKFYKRKTDKMLKVELRSGRTIKLTPEHPLFTVKGWKPVKYLGIGSRIATPRKLDFFGKEEPEDCKVKLLAYFIAEGHTRSHGRIKLARFTNSDEDIIKDFKKSVSEFGQDLCVSQYRDDTFGVIGRRKPETIITERDEKGHIVKSRKVVRGNPIISWLKDVGSYGELAKNKTIPEKVFQLAKEKLSLFLNRLFSCDGSIYKNGDHYRISYSTSSEKMAAQVQHLLLRFGILSRIRRKTAKYDDKEFPTCEIVIYGKFVKRFVNYIGFYGKKEQIQNKMPNGKRVRNPNIDTVPKEVWDGYKPDSWADIGRAVGYSYPKAMRECVRYSPSRTKLLSIAKADKRRDFELLAISDIFWDEIVSIEFLEGEFEVYDLTVPDYHNFVANDVIVHNSYSMGVMAEEMANLPDRLKKNLCALMIDTQGIFWTMKSPSERDVQLLARWDLKPAGFDTSVYVPEGQAKIFSDAGVEYDDSFSVAPSQLTADDWMDVFDLDPNGPLGIILYRTLENISGEYGLEDVISRIGKYEGFGEQKFALQNYFAAARNWGIFGEENMPRILEPGKLTVLDVSLTPQNVRTLLVALVMRHVLKERIKARRQEEVADIEMTTSKRVPMPWIFIDEAHNFLPARGRSAATDILNRIVKEGRQPGITLVLATQRPEKLHPDALAQSDMVISHRLTSKADISSLEAIMQTYVLKNISRHINELPKLKGTAIIMDDNSERLYKVRVRPRQSWHAGSSPVAV